MKEIIEHDDNGYVIYCKYSGGDETWWEYDENEDLVNLENTMGYECWWKYDEKGKQIEITKQEFEKIKLKKEQKEFLSRKPISKFELMEI